MKKLEHISYKVYELVLLLGRLITIVVGTGILYLIMYSMFKIAIGN